MAVPKTRAGVGGVLISSTYTDFHFSGHSCQVLSLDGLISTLAAKNKSLEGNLAKADGK